MIVGYVRDSIGILHTLLPPLQGPTPYSKPHATFLLNPWCDTVHLFLYDLGLPSGAGCTTMPLGEQPWSVHLEDLPGKCSVLFYSDT
jgi:hypothetical protein